MYSAESSNSSSVAAMPRLSRTGFLTFAQFAQQIEVLHIARAHLEDVDVRQHQPDLRDLHDLADHQHVELIAGLAQQLQSFFAHALKRIRRRSRLESAAAQHARARLRHLLSHGKKLLLRFHRAGPGHHHYLVAADLHSVGKFDDRPLRTKTAPRQFVRRADAVNVLHSGKNFKIAGVKIHPRAHRGQHGLPLAGSAMHGEAHPDQVFHHLLDLLIGR